MTSHDIPERYEIIEGVRYDYLKSPKYEHQKILSRFLLAFHSDCSQEGGEILPGPLDVHFDEENILQPDVIYIAKENMGIIRDGYIFGVPELVVEILSHSTGQRDKTIKKKVYEHFGVKEYWLADPNYATVDQFVLMEEGYRLIATLSKEDLLTSPTVPCLQVDLDTIFPEEER